MRTLPPNLYPNSGTMLIVPKLSRPNIHLAFRGKMPIIARKATVARPFLEKKM